jgi:integrase
MQSKLLASTVRVLTQQVPPAKETTIFDTVVPRFALRVRPKIAGRRTWPSLYFIRYVGPDGRERKFKIGSPATMDLETARQEARAKLAIVDRGGDPAAAKAALREQWSVAQAVEAYIASDEFRRKTPRGQATESATLRLHVVHRLGTSPLADLDLPRIRALVRAVEQDTRINARRRRLGGSGAARKTARLLSTMLGWCVVAGRLSSNPLLGAMRSLRLAGENPRETVITEPAQYARLFNTLNNMVADGTLRIFARAFITVAALTGMRRSELQALRWGAVDLGAGRIRLTTSKGARLARGGVKTETVSLPPFAAAALAGIRPEGAADDEQVFVPRRGSRLEINRDWLRVRERAELPPELTLHGLRHSAGTVAVMAGLSGPEVQKMLRHRNIATTARYIHLADQARLQDRALGHLAPPLPVTAKRPA